MAEATPTGDPLGDLRARIAATQEAAQRLAGEAQQAAREAASGRVPPQGWAAPQDRAARQEEAQALVALLQALRELVPAELQAQLTEVIRQVLLLLRALIDWWVDQLEQRPEAGRPDRREGPQDIPIA
jgi:hypothetical protein